MERIARARPLRSAEIRERVPFEGFGGIAQRFIAPPRPPEKVSPGHLLAPGIFSPRPPLPLFRRFWAFMDRTERHTNYPNLFRSTSLIHYLLVIFHWNGCLYHIVYKNNGFGSKNWVFNDSETVDVVTQYLQSYYWCCLALTTIGDLPRYLCPPVHLHFPSYLFVTRHAYTCV